jgi:hypothetical protein
MDELAWRAPYLRFMVPGISRAGNNLCFLVQSTAIEAKLADHVWELPEAA